MKNLNKHQRMGWIAVAFSIAIACLWAFWGANETFHEGWYYQSLLKNLGLTLLQYLSPMLIFMLIGLVSIYWPRVGGGFHIAVALFAAFFFDIRSNTVLLLGLIPLIGIGLLYWYGRLPSKKVAARWMIALPVLVTLVSGALPGYRVSRRIGETSLETQIVRGNGVTLTWAPAGPGWPREGTHWIEAQRSCQWLDQAGKTLASQPQNIWRLPGVDEAVRSMALHGENSRGVWNEKTARAEYELRPDKEFPLWDQYSPVIYWWTSTEVNAEKAYIIVYDGRVWERAKSLDTGSLGFRCVK
ncbi:MAG TPA: DUF1566 domain-containing protein [Chloroflexi bacterium]|nr:DUF1566 domain-containing protein [Chloroflexota bacterium]